MSGLLWPIFWILGMLALVVATSVIAFREKKAREEALKKMQPQPLDPGLDPDADPMQAEEGFGEPEMEGFGDELDQADFSDAEENVSR